MTLPAFPFTSEHARLRAFDVSANLPQASFEPDFGPPITRPRSTAIDEIADITIKLLGGKYAEFRTWWAVEARQGPFTWTRPDTGEAVIVHPLGGYTSSTNRALAVEEKMVEISFRAHVRPGPVE